MYNRDVALWDLRLCTHNPLGLTHCPLILSIYNVFQPPAKTFGEPAATEVHPVIPSPTLPHPNPFTFTVPEPAVIGAECDGHGDPGSKCPVLLSPCLDTAMPLTKTLLLPAALTIPLQ